ncbi:NAD-dependent epimerase/dehydratase family protein [Microbacterium sp. A84]|uniref:NAD-dependent epimerase/dehydratase family protein n=1 Tax=Microbacterium sp. A84 TaxID=3450715 RepID=UPI003F41C5A4
MSKTALLIGGTGPTGPAIATGLEKRGYDLTILHRGTHELDEVMRFPHIHGDVFSEEGIREALGQRSFDVVIASYGRLRATASVLRGRAGHFLSVGGVPVYRGFFDPSVFQPTGLPIPTREDADLAREDEDGKSYRVARTEQLLFELQPDATHFRYPYIYGPRQLAPREWAVMRRIIDGRPFIILPDGGLSLIPFGYVDNLAHAMMLAIEQPDESKGEIFNCGDDEKLTIRQMVELVADEMSYDLEIVSMPSELAIPSRPLQMSSVAHHRVVDTAKLRDRLGYHDVVPAREAVRRAVRWLQANPPARGGYEEFALQDPFDYGAEDRLYNWWKAAIADPPNLGYDELPGYGKSYAGPGTRVVRADTRI